MAGASNDYHFVNIDEDDIKNQILELIFNTNMYYRYLFHILYHYNQFHPMFLLNNNILNQQDTLFLFLYAQYFF